MKANVRIAVAVMSVVLAAGCDHRDGSAAAGSTAVTPVATSTTAGDAIPADRLEAALVGIYEANRLAGGSPIFATVQSSQSPQQNPDLTKTPCDAATRPYLAPVYGPGFTAYRSSTFTGPRNKLLNQSIALYLDQSSASAAFGSVRQAVQGCTQSGPSDGLTVTVTADNDQSVELQVDAAEGGQRATTAVTYRLVGNAVVGVSAPSYPPGLADATADRIAAALQH